MCKKIIFTLFVTVNCSLVFAAWQPDKPTDNDIRKQAPAQIRANWAAIATGTDTALLITNAKVSATAAIVDTKLATISTAGKVSGAALTSLSSVPGAAGALPIANGGTGQTTRAAALNALMPTQTGHSGKAFISDGTDVSLGYPASLSITSAAAGDILYYNGTTWARVGAGTSGQVLRTNGSSAPSWEPVNVGLGTTLVTGILPPANMGTGTPTASTVLRGDGSWGAGSAPHGIVALTSGSGNWTVPEGVTSVLAYVIGGGGAGGCGGNATNCSTTAGTGGAASGGYINITGASGGTGSSCGHNLYCSGAGGGGLSIAGGPGTDGASNGSAGGSSNFWYAHLYGKGASGSVNQGNASNTAGYGSGGGGDGGSSDSNVGGGGGGGGGVAIGVISVSGTVAYSVGAGGTANVNTTARNGGATTFGTLTANGGTGGGATGKYSAYASAGGPGYILIVY